jgi:hypothetical protein
MLKCDKCGTMDEVYPYSFESHRKTLYGAGSWDRKAGSFYILDLCENCAKKLEEDLDKLLTR